MSAPLTIGIDARKIRDFGIGRYLEGLLGGLAEIGGNERYVLFLGRRDRDDLPGALSSRLDPERFERVVCDAPLYSIRELFALRGAARRHGLDLLHLPHYPRPLEPGCPLAVTIHDAIHLSHPPSLAARGYAELMMRWSVRTASTLFTVSSAVRDDLADRLGVSRDRFRVTPNGVGPQFSPPPPESLREFQVRRDLREPFVLGIASHRPHKNLTGAIEGFLRAAIPGARLVIPVRDRDAERRVRRLLPDEPSLRLLRDVTDPELALAYASARVVLIPSLAEGFGLPALEAAACGGVVLASDVAAHREVLGETVELFDPRDPAALARGLEALWADETRRRELASRGPKRAREFSWVGTARLTREGYRAAVKSDFANASSTSS